MNTAPAGKRPKGICMSPTTTTTTTTTTSTTTTTVACTPGAPGCGWEQDDMQTGTQTAYGTSLTPEAGVLGANFTTTLGSIVTVGGTFTMSFTNVPALEGQTVDDFLAIANHVLGGGSSAIGLPTISAVLRSVNEAFVGGTPSTFAQDTLVNGACL